MRSASACCVFDHSRELLRPTGAFAAFTTGTAFTASFGRRAARPTALTAATFRGRSTGATTFAARSATFTAATALTGATAAGSTTSTGEVRPQLVFSELAVAILVELLQSGSCVVDLFGGNLSVLVGVESRQHGEKLHHVPTRSAGTTPFTGTTGATRPSFAATALGAAFGATAARRTAFRTLSIRPDAEQQTESSGQNSQFVSFSHEKLQSMGETLRLC